MAKYERPKLSGFTGKRRSGIKGLHHAAYRCKNTEETRKFYEDFIGLKMVEALHLKMEDGSHVLHSFFQLDDEAHSRYLMHHLVHLTLRIKAILTSTLHLKLIWIP